MERGEVARVSCTAEYGYGSKGNFSFPSVPPDAALTYEVEVLDWEEVDDGEEVGAGSTPL
jgi:FKBP-type peptidyl-prolyl cis-trans isomerase